ncbi:MAG: lipoate-protein ligase B/lipoate synthase [Ilumatobacteraceae bacterium]|nr:lipoate-protein ligase B/lipoate synthase [Ilumatobacteraceae bacterium]
MTRSTEPLHVRWLGRVPYREALAVQESMFRHGTDNHLLLLEHPHVFTHGPRADLGINVLVEPASVGAELVSVQRGGDVTYHGPGQLVGYPIVSLPSKHGGVGGPPDTVAHVCSVEQLIIDTLAELGLPNAGRLTDFPGVWLDADGPNPRKICAIGVRVSRGRTMHGFALNVATDMRYMREYIIPCGIADRPVTSLAEEGIDASLADVVEVVARLAAVRWGPQSEVAQLDRQDVAWHRRPEDLSAFSRGEGPGRAVRTAADHGVAGEPTLERAQPVRLLGRLASAGVDESVGIASRKPEWLRPKVVHGPEVLALKKTVRDLDLITVCEEAGCPNLSECWSDGTATFMVLGESCTRACGFCLVDTHKPLAPDADEPRRVAEAVVRMGLEHAVLTMVARDDLVDGGMAHVAACVEAIRLARPATRIETLISDAKGDATSLQLLFAAGPDVLNHNMETVPRLQRAVRPSAGYARSMSVLAQAKLAGLSVKSGLIVGMGETSNEVDGALADLATIGVDIVTIGQYLRPTSNHLPVHRWVDPHEFDRWKAVGEGLGIGHVEASPLTRSSYHARQSAEAVPSAAGARIGVGVGNRVG